MICLLLLLTASTQLTAQDTWLFSPYRVNIWISYGPSVRVTSVQRAELRRVLRARIAGWAKSTWDLRLPRVPTSLRADVALHPEQMTYQEIREMLDADSIQSSQELAGSATEEKTVPRKTVLNKLTVLDGDKLFVVSVTDSGTQLRVQARELDCRALSWSRISERRLEIPEQLGDAVFSAVAEAFAPVIEFREFRTIPYQNEAGQDKSREVLIGTVRAAGLMYRAKATVETDDQGDETGAGEDQQIQDAATNGQASNGLASSIGVTPALTDKFELDRRLPGYIGRGMVMRAVVRRDDRYGNPLIDGITEVVSTYLFVQELSLTGIVSCKVYTTGSLAKNPVRARSSSRTHKYGLLVRPTADKTDLRLVDRDAPDRGLQGYTVFSKTPQFPNETNFFAEDGDPRTLGQTDWRGIIEVDRLSTQLRIIYVRNGQQILARIPFVPGLDDVHLAMLPSDDLRLQVESFIVGFQMAVMDVVIQRHVLAFRIRAELKKSDVAKARVMYDLFTSLPTKKELETRLQNRKSIFTAGASIDRFSRGKIDALFSRTQLLMDSYIDVNLDAELFKEVPASEEDGG